MFLRFSSIVAAVLFLLWSSLSLAVPVDVKVLIQDLYSSDEQTQRHAAELLIATDAAVLHQQEIVSAGLFVLKRIENGNQRSGHWSEHLAVLKPDDHLENLIISLLLRVAPRHPRIVRRLLTDISRPLDIQGSKAIAPFSLALENGESDWPIKRYLLDAAQRAPQLFIPALGSRLIRQRMAAASCLALAGQLEPSSYATFLRPFTDSFGRVHLERFRYMQNLSRIIAHSQAEPVRQTKLVMLADFSRFAAYLSANAANDPALETLQSLPFYVWSFAELVKPRDIKIPKNQYDDFRRTIKKLNDDYQDIVSASAHTEMLKALEYADQGDPKHRQRVDDNINVLTRLLYSYADDPNARSILNDDEIVAPALAYSLWELEEPVYRKQYLDDIRHYGGKGLTKKVLALLLEIGGERFHREMANIPACHNLETELDELSEPF